MIQIYKYPLLRKMVKSEAKINDFLLHMSNALIYYNPDPSIKIELSEFRRRWTILTVCHFSFSFYCWSEQQFPWSLLFLNEMTISFWSISRFFIKWTFIRISLQFEDRSEGFQSILQSLTSIYKLIRIKVFGPFSFLFKWTFIRISWEF